MDINRLVELQEKITKLKKKASDLEEKYYLNLKYDYDPDSSPKAWKYFLDVYNDVLDCDTESKDNLFDEKYGKSRFWEPSTRGVCRVVGTFNYVQGESLILAEKYLIVGENIGIAGDCVFNFNEGKRNSFWKGFVEENEQLEETERELVRNILDLCLDMHHSYFNFSLMPRTGAMQRAKNQRGDRPDILLLNLKKYYETKSEDILTGLGKEEKYEKSRKALKHFLQEIRSFENYCRMFYHLDSEKDNELLESLLKNGAEEISEYKDLIDYIELAVRYWEHQAKYYEKIMRENPNHAKIQNNETKS